jgi:hypothetical protein
LGAGRYGVIRRNHQTGEASLDPLTAGGKLLHGHAGRIAAGSARAVFLPVQMAPAATNQADPPALICVLPLNAAAEQVFEINLPGLELRTDQLVSFQACSSTRHGRCRPGDVLPWDADAFHALPPLQTIIRTAHGVDVGSDRTVPVRLAAKMNALGLLQISCVGTDPQTPQSWPLAVSGIRPILWRLATGAADKRTI